MMRRRGVVVTLLLTLVLWLAGAPLQPVAANPMIPEGASAPHTQDYSFAVPELLMDVTVQPEGSVRIVYDITFDNQGDPIDIVDIGTPTDDYDVDEIEAAVDGQPVRDIRPSTYIDTGVEVHLGNQTIQPGETATLHMEFVMPDMVYADTTDEELASLQITPTWFDESLVRGSGNIEIRVTMLPGIEPDEVLYQDVPFTDVTTDDQGRVVVVWLYEDVQPTQPYRVGVSFPRRGLTNVIEITFWDLVGRWLGQALSVVGGVLATCLPVIVPLLIIFAIIRGAVRMNKPNYLPPIAQVEGGGIKRGLTAPESAVILELPLNKVLGLVVFGMLEKGLVRQTKTDPLTVEVIEDFRVTDKAGLTDSESRRTHRRRVAQQKGTVIHAYEHPFLDLIEEHPGVPVNKLRVVKPMETLVNGVAAKMKGFDLSDTQDYYRRVIDRAVEQASAIGDIEQREAYLDQYLPWVMMQPNYRPVLTMGGYHYWPMWARQSRVPTSGGGARGGAATGRSGGGTSTTFGDVSASFAGWAENTMGGMAAAIMPTALSRPAEISRTPSGGGSRGGGCACACAGCACACACAGGGR